MDYRIFNVCTTVNACNCTWGCTDTHKRVCTESWLWENHPLLHQGTKPASAVWRSEALPTELHPHLEMCFSVTLFFYFDFTMILFSFFFFLHGQHGVLSSCWMGSRAFLISCCYLTTYEVLHQFCWFFFIDQLSVSADPDVSIIWS